MAIKRQYFTYITNIVTSSDYPGGAYEHPNNFIGIHYGPSVTLEDFRLNHYEDEDSRVLASAISDDTHMTNEGDKTVLDFMVEDGLKNFNCIKLTDSQALALARLFSPARTIDSTDEEGNPVTLTVSEYAWDTSTPPKLVQTIS